MARLEVALFRFGFCPGHHHLRSDQRRKKYRPEIGTLCSGDQNYFIRDYFLFLDLLSVEKMKLFAVLVICFVVLCAVFANAAKGAVPGSDIQTPKGSTLVKVGPKGSTLYKLNTEGSVYEDTPFVLNLAHGSSYEQGYDTAYLMGDKFIENYNNLMVSMLGDEWWEPAVAGIISKFLNWQWNSYLKVSLSGPRLFDDVLFICSFFCLIFLF